MNELNVIEMGAVVSFVQHGLFAQSDEHEHHPCVLSMPQFKY